MEGMDIDINIDIGINYLESIPYFLSFVPDYAWI
jgi:hypothetical protein